jgi:hypothetical protein
MAVEENNGLPVQHLMRYPHVVGAEDGEGAELAVISPIGIKCLLVLYAIEVLDTSTFCRIMKEHTLERNPLNARSVTRGRLM